MADRFTVGSCLRGRRSKMTIQPEIPSGVTLHLTPAQVWFVQEPRDRYRPEAFAAEGFVHCTDGESTLIEVANRYYRDDPRDYLVLSIDLDRLPWRIVYEDTARQYPHVYGPIERKAVVAVRRMERTPDGAFTAIGEAAP